MSNNFQGQNDFLQQFVGHEKTYLNHLLDLEMPSTSLTCSICGHIEPGFRCLDCYGSHWWCKSCLIENVSLCDLGYVFTLGHSSPGHSCLKDDNLFGDWCMTLIHVNGVALHQVLSLQWCKFRAWTAFLPSTVSFHFQPTGNSVYPWCFGLLWDWCYGMQNLGTEFFPEIKESNKQCIPRQCSSKFIL